MCNSFLFIYFMSTTAHSTDRSAQGNSKILIMSFIACLKILGASYYQLQ